MPRPTPRILDRSLDFLAGDVHIASEARSRALGLVAAQEIEQQIRVPLSGEAGSGWGFADRWVGFEWPFIYAPASRGPNPFSKPHFNYGIEHLSGQSVLVIIHASVIRWKTTSNGLTVGAQIRYAASAPTFEGTAVTYSAVAHLTFQGWAAETEEGEGA